MRFQSVVFLHPQILIDGAAA